MKEVIINAKRYKRPVLVFAMRQEAGAYFEGFNRIFTGVGKINASYSLMKYLINHQPDLIINLGTAGSFSFKKGAVVCCTSFIQRDMDASPLGISKYKTPFSTDKLVLKYGMVLKGLPQGVCGTGDHFENAHTTNLYSIVDMEAYALALIAKRENIPFLCLKYISDGADAKALEDWTREINKASESLLEALSTSIED
ncbi:nucleosidase [Elizabethkingia argentiflava]|uniref:Nucleosidase n=1 Tax=Elizabethkingia argenteiflava TaxID=2681556 RepID=A0A845PV94_9FLAO|nr:nucleosidase [Elizabethkingia argenteiflava]NAW51575.1 nucleosidase [Elizabethkingia argenteiflava]